MCQLQHHEDCSCHTCHWLQVYGQIIRSRFSWKKCVSWDFLIERIQRWAERNAPTRTCQLDVWSGWEQCVHEGLLNGRIHINCVCTTLCYERNVEMHESDAWKIFWVFAGYRVCKKKMRVRSIGALKGSRNVTSVIFLLNLLRGRINTRTRVNYGYII